MQYNTILLSSILSLFSTAVMSYISMATPIGPWIAPTLVLIALLWMKLWYAYDAQISAEVALATFSGSIGGILATSFGFSFPTLYFLDPELFLSWMSQPYYFMGIITAISLTAGFYGFYIANVIEYRLIDQEQLAFPIAPLVHKVIIAHQSVQKGIELVVGFVSTTIFCFLQDGLGTFRGIMPKALILVQQFQWGIMEVPLISFDIWPILWAIGFVTGHVIALPLMVGALSRIFIINPLRNGWYFDYGSMEFILAFASGMILVGTIMSFSKTPQTIWKALQSLRSPSKNMWAYNRSDMISLVAIIGACMALCTYFTCSFLLQIYLLLTTFACTYEIANQTGKIGLARLGMFATFVMVPAMLLFKLTMVQIVLIATFVEVCGGVAADVLFGRKMARLAHISRDHMQRYQILGIIISSVSIGYIFWALINHFGLGTPELFAQKAQNRQLLIEVKQFDWHILALGALYGYVLKRVRINPSLVLGGILMPINVSFGLIVGGMSTYLCKNKEEWYPWWSGVFAANSLWMLVRSIL